jgi:hypothetical protein
MYASLAPQLWNELYSHQLSITSQSPMNVNVVAPPPQKKKRQRRFEEDCNCFLIYFNNWWRQCPEIKPHVWYFQENNVGPFSGPNAAY